MPLAYGYIRYSSDKQEHGDSVRRQQDGIVAWLARNATVAQLDTSLGDRGFFVDRGMTGFAVTGQKRGNLADYALGEFMQHCRNGRVQPGSLLIVESADRLSRESAVIALNLFTELLMLNVVVITLSPEMEYRTDADIGKLITAGVTIGRAHDESQVKHRRNAWIAKRANASVQPMTSLLPAWCTLVGAKKVANRLVGGEIKPVPAKVETVRRLFKLVLSGKGCKGIAEQLNGDRTPVVGRGKKWTESGVYNIVTSPAVIGEFHPHTGVMGSKKKGRPHTRKPTKEVYANYYPAIIDRGQFALVKEELARRFKFKGRRGHHVNLFAGMLNDARDGGPYSYRHSNSHPPTLIPVHAKNGTGGTWASFNAEIFERILLSKLTELKGSDIFPENDIGGKVVTLSSQYAEKENELHEFQEQIDGDPKLLKTLKPTLLRLESEREALANQLADAQREAASPLAEAWGELRSVAEIAKDASDDTRQRCRSALRRVIDNVTVLFTGSKMTRKAAVRVQFRSGLHRDYLIVYWCRNRHRKNPPAPIVISPPRAWHEQAGEFDLRNAEHAKAVEKLLDLFDPDTLNMVTPTAAPTKPTLALPEKKTNRRKAGAK